MKFDISSTSDKVATVIFTLLGTAGLAVVGAIFSAWLWNQLMPELFGFKQITWIQAIGLGLLIRCFWGTGLSSK